MDGVFHRFLGENFCGVIGERENRGGDFHMKKVPSKIVVENCLKIVEKWGILYKEFEINKI